MAYKLRTNPYYFTSFHIVDTLALLCTRPAYLSLDNLLSCFISTTEELKRPYQRLPNLILFPFFYIFMAFASLPLAVIGFVISHVLSYFRTSYRVHISTKNTQRPYKKLQYSFSTANLCLGPEAVCRYNNLSENTDRATIIGRNLLLQQRNALPLSPIKYNNAGLAKNGHQNGISNRYETSKVPKLGTSETFPLLDILCLQETNDYRTTNGLISELEEIFPYVIYDVRMPGLWSNWFASGLMLASRYEITHVDFQPFTVCRGHMHFVNKGVLMCKVLLHEDERTGVRDVGYITTTHLQAYQGTESILRPQLTFMYKAISQFRSRTTRSRDDHVMFDVIAGDFNFDNMSPGDEGEYSHPLFSQYIDVCRIRPGLDRNWAIGTERRQLTLYNEEVESADSMKFCLDKPHLLHQYVLDADVLVQTDALMSAMPARDEEGEFVVSEVSGRRRIDCCVYNKDDGVVVTGYNFVTQFASLTDHIPVCMTVMAPQSH